MPKVPTLTDSGWIDDVVSVGNRLMDYFLTSEHSQTQFYRGQVASLPYLVQQFGSEPTVLADRVRETVQRYLRRHFLEVQVNTRATDLIETDGRYNLQLDVLLNYEGRQVNLGRLIEIGDSQILGVQAR